MMSDKELVVRSKELLLKNVISGYSKSLNVEYHYMKPSLHRYPYQYFWDTCFHVFSMTSLGMANMAKRCIRSLFAMQQEDGFVGHMLFWKSYLPHRITDIFQRKPAWEIFYRPHMSALIQPPLAAHAVERIYKSDGDKEFLKEMVPKLKKYYEWIRQNRDFEGDGLISIISYFESGMDWKPSYDEVLNLPPDKANLKNFIKVTGIDFMNFLNNYNLDKIKKRNTFLVKDVGYNTIYAENLQILGSLCKELEDPEWKHFNEDAKKTRMAMMEFMYDEKDFAFYDVYGYDNKKLKVLTPTIFFPIILKEMPEEICRGIVQKHLFNNEEFAARYPIPSVAMNHPSFNPRESVYIWRGPTWIVYNWFLHRYLLHIGFRKEAALLINTVKKLISKSGFREYYNPFTGEGYGAYDFTWGTLIADMIHKEPLIKS